MIRLWGCPACGSEHTFKDIQRIKKENREGYTCLFCCSKEPLAYLGKFKKEDCYNN